MSYEIPRRKVVLAVLATNEPYTEPSPGTPVRLLIEHGQGGPRELVDIHTRYIDNTWHPNMIRVEGFMRYEDTRCTCVAVYNTDEERDDYRGVITVYVP